MSDVETPGKVSLFHLFAMMCVLGPPAAGSNVGSEFGFIGIATGILAGLPFGFLSAFVFWRALRWMWEHWLPHELTGTMQEKALLIFVLVAAIAWVIATIVGSWLTAEYVITCVAS